VFESLSGRTGADGLSRDGLSRDLSDPPNPATVPPWRSGLWRTPNVWRAGGGAATRASGLGHVLECLAAGMTIPDIVDAYPSLTVEAVRGVLAELAEAQAAA
jgi:hypothetical protein